MRKYKGGNKMKYVFYENNNVTLIYYDEPQFSLNGKDYFTVDEIPEPEHKEGHYPIMKCNPATKEIWFEYLEKELTPEERRIKELEGAVLELTEMIAQLQVQGGAN